MKRILKLGAALLGVLLIALVSLAAYSELQWDRRYGAPYPDIQASADPAVIEQGRYLVYGPAHCAACHTPADQHDALNAVEVVPMVGGFRWNLPLGTVRSPNITNDPATGVGRYTDGEIARILRHGVKPDGRAGLPFMEFQNLSDQDLIAVISFLRAAPGVRNEVPPSEPNFIGRAIMATLIRPKGPAKTPPVQSPLASSPIQRGEYLVNSVANCAGCHSERNMLDGSYTGPRLAGGSPMPLDSDPSVVLVPPNLTPDPETGHIYRWTPEQFIARFRVGRVLEGTHMPWSQFARMSDEDLTAIYRYLWSLEPVRNDTGPIRRSSE